jgi:hypothetical protein
LALDSVKDRQAIAILHEPQRFDIRDSHILDPSMYYWREESPSNPQQGLHLVAIVLSRPQAEAALGIWGSVKAEALIERTRMSVLIICGAGEECAPEDVPRDVVTKKVKNPEGFSARTGIRVFPFSLIMASGGNVLAAGPVIRA